MNFDDYEQQAAHTSIYADAIADAFANGDQETLLLWTRLSYLAGKLNGESGEVAEEIFKAIRDEGGEVSLERRQRILKECGDSLFYLTRIAAELDSSLEEIAQMNAGKISGRHQRGAIRGDGEDR